MNKIIRAMMEMGVKGVSKTAGPEDIAFQAVFFIGPAGSGKSFVRSKRYLKYMRFRIIDPDEVKKTHKDYDPENPFRVHDWSKEISNAEYTKIVTSGSGEPVVVDGTGRKSGNIIKKARLARANGYRIFLIYVWVPWQVSIFRNRNRKRFVPEALVLDQVEGVAETFGQLKSFVDKFKVISNFTSADVDEAKADIAIYPVPQKKRPPRPDELDYGMQRAASDKVEASDGEVEASGEDEIASALIEMAGILSGGMVVGEKKAASKGTLDIQRNYGYYRTILAGELKEFTRRAGALKKELEKDLKEAADNTFEDISVKVDVGDISVGGFQSGSFIEIRWELDGLDNMQVWEVGKAMKKLGYRIK